MVLLGGNLRIGEMFRDAPPWVINDGCRLQPSDGVGDDDGILFVRIYGPSGSALARPV
jgi:hypothetical protein